MTSLALHAKDAVARAREHESPAGQPLGAGVVITALPWPDHPVRLTPLVDMRQFEEQWEAGT